MKPRDSESLKKFICRANISIVFSIISLFIICCEKGGDLEDIEYQIIEADSIFNTDSHYIVVIGDIQEYTKNDDLAYYLCMTNHWIRNQQKYFNNFACVLQNGDITWSNVNSQWVRADYAFSFLGDEILFIPSTGNHDYDWVSGSRITDRNSSLFNSLTNIKSLKKQQIQQYEKRKLDNIIVPIKMGSDSLYVIALEFGPRKEAVAWADSIVRSNICKRFILMTHEWLSPDGLRVDKESYAASQLSGLSYSTPEEVWNKLVYPNDNILCVLCGHNGFCKYLFSENKRGRKVCQVLFNLQYQVNGGDGMVQLWEFPDNENIINISVYNTITRKYHLNPETRVTIQL